MILWSEDRRAHDFGIVDAASSFALPGLYDNRAELLFPPLRVQVPSPYPGAQTFQYLCKKRRHGRHALRKLLIGKKLDHFASQRHRLLFIT
jgi:hypothetical protein